jgi:hypothetical protein
MGTPNLVAGFDVINAFIVSLSFQMSKIISLAIV